jgi:hypothetical protein
MEALVMVRAGSATLFILASTFGAVANPADDGRWHAGAYSYSDQRGGFMITAISGSGSRDDPVVIEQEMLSASPATLVIRAEQVIRPRLFGTPGPVANGFIHIRIVLLNNSGLPWVEFEFELQERDGEPSSYGDGLSFDQRRTDSTSIAASRYASFSREYEPYDRIRFTDGNTDALESCVFEFLITDFTPVSQFYLILDPRIPSS